MLSCGLPSFGNRAETTIDLSVKKTEVKLESLFLVQFLVLLRYVLSQGEFFFSLFSALLLLFSPSH